MLRNAKLEEATVGRLQGELVHLDKVHGLQIQGASGALDTQARVPWHPTGEKTNTRDEHPERLGKKRDHPIVDETFNPIINRNSIDIMEQLKGEGRTASFLQRLRSDMIERKRRKKVNGGMPSTASQQNASQNFHSII